MDFAKQHLSLGRKKTIANKKNVYPPGVFFKGSQIFGQKNKGLKFLREILRGLKSISKFDQFTDTDPNIAKIVTISQIKNTNSETPLQEIPAQI